MATQAEIEAHLKLKDELSAKLPGVQKELGGVAKGLDLAKVGAVAAGAAMTAMAAVAATAAAVIAKSTKAALDYADALDNQSKATQASTEALQVFNEGAKRAGVGPEAITTAIQRMQRAIGDGTKESIDAIAGLGLSISHLKTLKPEEQFRLIQERLGGIPNEAEKAAIAMEVFGRSGANLLALSGDALPKLETRMRELGLVIDEEVVSAVDALGDDLDMLSRTAEMTWVQFGAGLASSNALREVVILLTDALGTLNAILGDNREAISEWIDAGIFAAIDAIEQAGVAMLEFSGIAVKVGDVIERMKTSPVEALLSGQNPFADLEARFQDVDKGVSSLTAKWTMNFDKMRDRVSKTSEGIGSSAPSGLVGALALSEKASKQAQKTYEDQIKSLIELDQQVRNLASGIAFLDDEALGMAESWETTTKQVEEATEALEEMFVAQTKLGSEMGFQVLTAEEYADIFSRIPEGVGDVVAAEDRAAEATARWREQQQISNEILRAGTDIMHLFGIEAGSTAGQILSLGSSLAAAIPAMTSFQNSIIGSNASGAEKVQAGVGAAVGGISAIASATSRGGAGASAGRGAMAGAAAGGQIGGPWGAAIGAGIGAAIGFYRGRHRTRAINDISREIGSTIDEAMLQVIRDSGKHSQTFITEIFAKDFAEGKGDVNRFAQEIGDLFSFLERGEISELDVVTELKESIPLLIEHFGELGETGQMEVSRIIDAAKLAGIEIEELGALILMTLDDAEVLEIVNQLGVTKAAAEALGVTFDQLSNRVQGIFAPETLETLADNFGKTTEEMRQILGDLGIAVQTDLERLAAAAGLTVEDFRALGEALQQSTGIPAEQLAEFMKQTGQTAEELAAALGVDVSASIGSINSEAAETAQELFGGANEAARMADELERAARAAANINVGGLRGFESGIPMQHGGIGETTRPTPFVTSEHGQREGFAFFPGGLPRGGVGSGVSISIGNVTVGGGGDAREVARQIAEELAVQLERGTSPLRRPIQRIADGSA